MIIVHQLLMDESVECHIPSSEISVSFPDHVDNILTYLDIEDLIGLPFAKLQQFGIAISRRLLHYKNSFIGKARDCFKI